MNLKLDKIFKAYDVRGIVGESINEEVVSAIAAAVVDTLNLNGETIIVGGDMRPSTQDFAQAFAQGASARGANATLIGECSTDQLYFVSGYYKEAAVMFTASHNPAEYNGLKMCRAGAVPISSDDGLYEIRDLAQQYCDKGFETVENPGEITRKDTLKDYAQYLRTLVNLSNIRPLKVVVDAGNGMAGKTFPAVLGDQLLPALPLDIVPMYFDLDGTFPNHPANPLDPENLKDLKKEVVKQHADIGLAFDGDADRCFVVDETGHDVTPSAITIMVGIREVDRATAAGESNPTVLHNLITSRAVPEQLQAAGASTQETRVGHSFIKADMAKSGAVFGGEHSAHFYFRDFFNADSGMLAAMHVLAMLGNQDKPLSQLSAKFNPYFSSGEINSLVEDIPAAVHRVQKAFKDTTETHTKDGWTFNAKDKQWWFNLRASNTEPFLRLNVEAHTQEDMEKVRDQVLKLIKE
ncbi:MAG: phosphomannomutase/phosphoglucomutase [Micrococcaceae bacterium]